MDSSTDQSLIDELARSLVADHGYRQSLAIIATIRASCAAVDHAQASGMAAFWSRVCNAIRKAGTSEPILIGEGSLCRPFEETATRHDAVLAPAASTSIDRHVGQRLRARRMEIGLPIELLARSLDLSPDAFRRIEAGRLRLGAAKLLIALQLLRIGPAYVFHGYASALDERADHDDNPTRH